MLTDVWEFFSRFELFWIPFFVAIVIWELILRHARATGKTILHSVAWLVGAGVSAGFALLAFAVVGIAANDDCCFTGVQYGLLVLIGAFWLLQLLRTGVALLRSNGNGLS
ncbi:MAG: hypothetical protein ACRBI6_22945 [Acidimicrobiales bacterium]